MKKKIVSIWSHIMNWSLFGKITSVILLLMVLFFGYNFLTKPKSTAQFIPVNVGSITETVSVTGNTTPTKSVSLSFENSGVVNSVYSDVGQKVFAGYVLASLKTDDLSAQLAQAEANVGVQKAKLDGIKAGAQPDDIAASKAAAAKAEQDLSNLYAGASDILNDALAKSNDAVRTQTNSLFANADNTNISITFITSDNQAATNAKSERLSAGSVLNTWQKDLIPISPLSEEKDIDSALSHGMNNLVSIRQMLSDISTALNAAVNLDNNTLSTNKAALTVAVNEVNASFKNINALSQNIASQKLLVEQAKAQLSLKISGATDHDIAAQTALLEQAEAAADSVRAKIGNSRIIAPINGTVTKFDAKVGQVATAGSPLISIISDNSLEINAEVPETDIGKISVGNPVKITLDAFPNESFYGKIFYIDPAQTVNQGVVDYKIKISFDKVDVRIKSGLTSNLSIETKTDKDALILPQYAILQNDKGSFVRKIIDGKATDTPVTIGIQDESGNVEILSGVSKDEKVVNIGLK